MLKSLTQFWYGKDLRDLETFCDRYEYSISYDPKSKGARLDGIYFLYENGFSVPAVVYGFSEIHAYACLSRELKQAKKRNMSLLVPDPTSVDDDFGISTFFIECKVNARMKISYQAHRDVITLERHCDMC